MLDCSDSGDDDFVDVQASSEELPQPEGREEAPENTEDAVPVEDMLDDGLQEIRAWFTDVEVADILNEAAHVTGLRDYDVWFKLTGKSDPRLARG